jgi:L,D-transpeptidase YcbB
MIVVSLFFVALGVLFPSPFGQAFGYFSPSRAMVPIEISVAELIRQRLEMQALEASGHPLYASKAISEFYERRGFRPAWVRPDGGNKDATDLLNEIRTSDEDGLHPNDYHLPILHTLQNESPYIGSGRPALQAETLADADLLLTDAFLLLGSHLLNGRLDPETLQPQWHATRGEGNLVKELETALESHQISDVISSLRPPYPAYGQLKEVLRVYRDLALKGGWPKIDTPTPIKPSERGEVIRQLRQRLTATGPVQTEGNPDEDLYDEMLEDAVRQFQAQHGLVPNGVIGPRTVSAFSVPVEDRIRQVEVNLERWRWLPLNLGREYILVNIANFTLQAVSDAQRVMEMRVVVGKPYAQTPAFNAMMSYVVLNPSWNVPNNIANNELLKHVQDDPQYLSKYDFKVLEGWGKDSREVDPLTVDWARFQGKSMPYRFQQMPGPHNPLGRIKFMLPNPFNVYLHDTSAPELFKESPRGFSHGCVRIERPLDLAEFVLRTDPHWSRDAIVQAMEQGTEQTISLPKPVPVYLSYFTVWSDSTETIHFSNDVYNRDAAVSQGLQQAPPELP